MTKKKILNSFQELPHTGATRDTNVKKSKQVLSKKVSKKDYEKENPFATYAEQIKAIEGKGIKIDISHSQVEVFLKHHSYFKVSRYIYHMYKKKRGFSKNFSTLQKIYLLDEKIRVFAMEYIMRLEISLSSTISYLFSEKYNTLFPHLKSESLQEVIQPILKDKQSFWENKEDIVKDYRKKYYNDTLPLSMIFEFISFRDLSNVCVILKYDNIKREVVERYIRGAIHGIDDETGFRLFRSWLNSVIDLRNQCAHNHSLLFSNIYYPQQYEEQEEELSSSSYFSNIRLPRKYRKISAKREYKEKNLLSRGNKYRMSPSFHVLSCVRHFMNLIDENNKMTSELYNIFNLMEIQSTELEQCRIPSDWKDLYPWKQKEK